VKKVLLFAPTPSGGLAEHVFYQAQALQKSGLEVICLATGTFLSRRQVEFNIRRGLFDMPPSHLPKWMRRPWQVFSLVTNEWLLAFWIVRHRPDFVLLDTYAEYLSPLWIWPHLLVKHFLGIQYVANLHDPVRKGLIGPPWWHKWSFNLAYRPLSIVLVHGPVKPEAKVPERVRIVEVPVGIYDIRPSPVSREEVRRRWGVKGGQKVFLSFGHVRDGKNLDLAVRALKEVPDSFLVIAGSVASASDRSFSFYRQLAEELGVSERCHLREGFVPDNELGALFEGTDFVLLTYSASFHSQSGVLNIAARANKPVLASAAPGPMLDVVRRFNLGIAVEPDSAAAVARGVREMMTAELRPDWTGYAEFAGWNVNVRKLLEAVEKSDGGSARPCAAAPAGS
jgi:glycosyltransferase involved in cell wall biosynthesis